MKSSFICVLFNLATICKTLSVQADIVPKSFVTAQQNSLSSDDPSSTDWLTENWSADDTPYRKIRAELEAQSKDKTLTTGQMLTFKNQWLSAKTDSLALFTWAYAVRLAQDNSIPVGDMPKKISQYFDAFPLTHSYEFDRLHFLCNEGIEIGNGDYVGLAKRLYERDKNDAPVIYDFAFLLTGSEDKRDIIFATKIAAHLLQLRPAVPKNHSMLGWTYYVKWLNTRRKADRLTALHEYSLYLQETPANAPGRVNAKAVIDGIDKIHRTHKDFLQ